jgi:hypothetical protein
LILAIEMRHDSFTMQALRTRGLLTALFIGTIGLAGCKIGFGVDGGLDVVGDGVSPRVTLIAAGDAFVGQLGLGTFSVALQPVDVVFPD